MVHRSVGKWDLKKNMLRSTDDLIFIVSLQCHCGCRYSSRPCLSDCHSQVDVGFPWVSCATELSSWAVFFCPCSAMSQCQDVPSDTSLCPLWRFSAKMIFSVFAVTERSLSVAGTIHPFFGDWYCSDIKSSVSSVSFSNASLISWRIDPHFYLTDPGHFFASHFWGYRGCHCEGLIVSERNEWPLRLKDPAVPPKHSCNLSD